MENFKATVTIKLVVDVPVKGGTFEEALENAKKIDTTDVVDIKGDFLDSKPTEVVNIWIDKDWLE